MPSEENIIIHYHDLHVKLLISYCHFDFCSQDDKNDPVVVLHSLIALEKFAQTSKLTLVRRVQYLQRKGFTWV